MIIHHRATPSSLRAFEGGQMDSFNPSLVHGGGPSNLAGCAQRTREIGALLFLVYLVTSQPRFAPHSTAKPLQLWAGTSLLFLKNMASRTLDSSP